jgi:hypothetical protein
VAIALAGVLQVCGPGADAEAHRRPVLAVLPFEIDDNSGEVGAPDRHDAMLAGLTRFVREDIAATGIYDVVDAARVKRAVAAENSGTYLRMCSGCERDIAKSVGADRVMIGWIFKMSSLVLSLHVVVKDVATGKPLYVKTFDFRGDNEKAWKRAADYMVQALKKQVEARPDPTN